MMMNHAPHPATGGLLSPTSVNYSPSSPSPSDAAPATADHDHPGGTADEVDWTRFDGDLVEALAEAGLRGQDVPDYSDLTRSDTGAGGEEEKKLTNGVGASHERVDLGPFGSNAGLAVTLPMLQRLDAFEAERQSQLLGPGDDGDIDRTLSLLASTPLPASGLDYHHPLLHLRPQHRERADHAQPHAVRSAARAAGAARVARREALDGLADVSSGGTSSAGDTPPASAPTVPSTGGAGPTERDGAGSPLLDGTDTSRPPSSAASSRAGSRSRASPGAASGGGALSDEEHARGLEP